ncbi:MAG: hypothetical protein LVQ75_04840 [Candidatus Babeliales bacterium]|jgi:hypothetical protein
MKKLIYLCFLIATDQLYAAEKTKPQTEQAKFAAFIHKNPHLDPAEAVRKFALQAAFEEFDQIRAQDPVQVQKIVSSVSSSARVQMGRANRAIVYYCSECGRAQRYDRRHEAEEHIKEHTKRT